MFAEQAFLVKHPFSQIRFDALIRPPIRRSFSTVTPLRENEIMAATIQISTNPISTPPVSRSEIRPQRRADSVVYWRRRFGVGVAMVILGAGLWTIATWATNSTVGVNPVVADEVTHVYVVQPGDTLWSVASQLDSDGDVRDTVDRLAALNGGSAIAVGQRLLIGT
jgi:acyl dehydratase